MEVKVINGCESYIYDDSNNRWACCFPNTHTGAHFGQKLNVVNFIKPIVLGWHEAKCGDKVIIEETHDPYTSEYVAMIRDTFNELCSCDN